MLRLFRLIPTTFPKRLTKNMMLSVPGAPSISIHIQVHLLASATFDSASGGTSGELSLVGIPARSKLCCMREKINGREGGWREPSRLRLQSRGVEPQGERGQAVDS